MNVNNIGLSAASLHWAEGENALSLTDLDTGMGVSGPSWKKGTSRPIVMYLCLEELKSWSDFPPSPMWQFFCARREAILPSLEKSKVNILRAPGRSRQEHEWAYYGALRVSTNVYFQELPSKGCDDTALRQKLILITTTRTQWLPPWREIQKEAKELIYSD